MCVDNPSTNVPLRELRGILEDESRPEAVTRAAFASELGEQGMATMLQGRMGARLAQALAARAVHELAHRSGSGHRV